MTSSRREIGALALARLLGDWRDGPGPMYERLARRIGQLLSDGRVAPEVRLPAERNLAAALGVSRTTIIRAYAALREGGLLESRRGSGSMTRLSDGSVERFVAWSGGTRLQPGPAPAIDLTVASPRADRAVLEALRDAAERVGGLAGDHGYHPLGVDSLRTAIAARYEQRGLPTAPGQILITAGAQQAIDLLVRTLVRRRESVVVESPTYPGAMDSLRLAGARMMALDLSTGPWRLDHLEELIAQTRPALAYLMPDFHNPTGQFMADAEREKLVRICHRSGVTLLVDETLADVRIDDGPRALPAAAHAPGEGVILIGSLSKALWGGLRVGWIRASARQIAGLAAMRSTAGLGGAPLEQIAAARLLPDLDAIAQARRPALAAQREALATAVADAGWELDPFPQGGLSAWVRLPEAGTGSLLADVAYRRGVVVIPGPRLSPDGALDRYVRIPYTHSPPTLRTAVQRLSAAWDEMAGIPGFAQPQQIV